MFCCIYANITDIHKPLLLTFIAEIVIHQSRIFGKQNIVQTHMRKKYEKHHCDVPNGICRALNRAIKIPLKWIQKKLLNVFVVLLPLSLSYHCLTHSLDTLDSQFPNCFQTKCSCFMVRISCIVLNVGDIRVLFVGCWKNGLWSYGIPCTTNDWGRFEETHVKPFRHTPNTIEQKRRDSLFSVLFCFHSLLLVFATFKTA